MKRTWVVWMLVAGLVTPLRAAINEVRVVDVKPDVQMHKEGAPDEEWLPVEKGSVLKQGDEISCDPDGTATLAFADNSKVVVRNTTQLKIASFFTEGGVVRTEILLKMGEVAAKVYKSEATKSDFRIKSPTGTASVRGTELKQVSYTPTTGLRVVLVEGFANLGGVRGTTQVNKGQAGSVNAAGDTISPAETTKSGLSSNAIPAGSTKEEIAFQQTNVAPNSGPPTTGSSGGINAAAEAVSQANEQIEFTRLIDFNDGKIPAEFVTQNAVVLNQFGPDTADGSPHMVIHTGGPEGTTGFARVGANFASGAILALEFDHNFVTTEEVGQFTAADDEFTVTLKSGNQSLQILRRSVATSQFTDISSSPSLQTLPGFMNLPNNTRPETLFQTGFQHFKGQFQVPAGQFTLEFQVKDGEVPEAPETTPLVESAAQIDNIRASVVGTGQFSQFTTLPGFSNNQQAVHGGAFTGNSFHGQHIPGLGN